MCVCVNQGVCKDGKMKNMKKSLSKSMRADVMLEETSNLEQKSEQSLDQTWEQSEQKLKRSRQRSDRPDQQSEHYDHSVKEPEHCGDRRVKSRNEHKQRRRRRQHQSLPAQLQLPTIMLNGDVLSPRPRDSDTVGRRDTQSADDETPETTSPHCVPRTRSISLTPLGQLPPLHTGTRLEYTQTIVG